MLSEELLPKKPSSVVTTIATLIGTCIIGLAVAWKLSLVAIGTLPGTFKDKANTIILACMSTLLFPDANRSTQGQEGQGRT